MELAFTSTNSQVMNAPATMHVRSLGVNGIGLHTQNAHLICHIGSVAHDLAQCKSIRQLVRL